MCIAGRINIVDLQQVRLWSTKLLPRSSPNALLSLADLQILNVDLTHVQTRVTELLKHDRSLVLLQGQLMDR